MHYSILLLLSAASASRLDQVFSPFTLPRQLELEEQLSLSNATMPQFELVKRAGTTCASGYSSCSTLGAVGLCCPITGACQQDQGGNVACCPSNAVCTGTIKPVTATTGASTTTTGTGSTTSFFAASTTTTVGTAGVTVGNGGGSTTTSGNIVFVQATGTTTQASGAEGTCSVSFKFPMLLTLLSLINTHAI